MVRTGRIGLNDHQCICRHHMCTGMDAHVLQLSVARRLRTARRSSLTENNPPLHPRPGAACARSYSFLSPPIYSPTVPAWKAAHQRASTGLVPGLARAAWLIQGLIRFKGSQLTCGATQRDQVSPQEGRPRVGAFSSARQVISRIALPEP